jgi:hypothetical protein
VALSRCIGNAHQSQHFPLNMLLEGCIISKTVFLPDSYARAEQKVFGTLHICV